MNRRETLKPILAVDMDEVLADSITLLVEQYNKAYSTHLSKQDLFGKTIYDCLPFSHISFIKEQQNRVNFYQEVAVIEGAQEGIAILSEKYDIYVVSAALEFPLSLASRCTFIAKNFPELTWKKLIFCANKPIIKADIILDDMTENLVGFGANGFLFTAYHNAKIDYPNRLNSWEEVVERLG
ncbi:5'(3')-deoxyribonucleotidase [Myroides sp. NP-2]|uniref:5' nucleotidase, NT5C type n=1 Tax=Myroides sp. NP-2 TaxID=2759945 RepID=UPI0015FB09C0|nr:5'(3')-deoxyribonucleotidase [Myroides sp. NP-2]MBB1150883.1 5'(3')-deoxyribonucleotidase [Myroides sp. NP-2]